MEKLVEWPVPGCVVVNPFQFQRLFYHLVHMTSPKILVFRTPSLPPVNIRLTQPNSILDCFSGEVSFYQTVGTVL